MKVDPNVAEGSGINLKEMIAKGPSAAAISQSLHVSSTHIKLGDNGPATIVVENTLSGKVKLAVQVFSGSGFDAALNERELGPSAKTQLVISRRPGTKFKPGHISISVLPTSQVVDIQVE
jgi:hypothetical protein